MTSSPDLIHELRASRPSAPAALRARVREISAAQQPARRSWNWPFPVRRGLLVAVPAAAALALASAGILGLARSDGTQQLATRGAGTTESATADLATGAGADDKAQSAPSGRAQRVSATLTVEVADSDGVSEAAQAALDLTRSLGGYVVSSSVSTGEPGGGHGGAAITVRVPVANVQDAITGLSGLGRIVTQQVTIDDLQATLDELGEREAAVRAQIARIRARLRTETLDAQTEAVLRARLQTLRDEQQKIRESLAATDAEARMSTIQLGIVTPESSGAVAPPSRLDRTIDEALNVLAWEAVVALGMLIVLAPFVLVGLAAWLGRRLYRRIEDERLLATP